MTATAAAPLAASAPQPAAPAPRRTAPARRLGGGFLAGAGSRLLPASAVFRWFGAAVAFHALAWLALLGAVAGWAEWRGGLGWPLAALHLATIGTLVASAIGASLQLLPVATRQPVRWPKLVGALWWPFMPGVALLALGMGLARPAWLAVGAALVVGVLAAWGVVLALNLRGARGMPGVVLHGQGALVALVVLALSATALVALWNGQPLVDREPLRALHLASGVFGVMGLLALGLSTILLPMFALAPVPDEAAQRRSALAALGALGAAAFAAFAPSGGPLLPVLRGSAVIGGALALAGHVRLMRGVLAAGMRGDLGRSGRLIRIAWAAAALALALAAARVALDAADGPESVRDALGRLFVVAAVGGWLLGFLFAVLQRILPFLASMHAARGRRRAPTPSAFTLDAALGWHLRGHVAAMLLLALALALPARAGQAALAAAALAGLAGALAFAAFFAVLLARLRASSSHET